MQNKFSNCFVCDSLSTSDRTFHCLEAPFTRQGLSYKNTELLNAAAVLM